MERTILHSDANCFYASVEMLYHPEYVGKPLAVGGDSEARHGIVLTANYIAKRSGVKTGMALWQAKQVCPDLIFVPPRMDLYLKFSSMLREIYSEYTNQVEPYGCDEAWLDVTDSFSLKGDGRKIAEEMHVKGLMNMQYAIEEGKVYVLEANPRASRTVPLVSKVCDIRMVPLAIDIVTAELTGRPSPVPALKEKNIPYYGVKEAVFPFNMFQEVDPVLGPEMRSTGEVLGLSKFFGEAFFKAQEATQTKLPLDGTVLISVRDKDKEEVVKVAKDFVEAGFKLMASKGTCACLQEAGLEVTRVKKLQEGRPDMLDLITNGDVDLVINTPIGKEAQEDDSYLRKAAIKAKVPYMTTIAAAKATISGIKSMKKPGCGSVKSLQELHAEITEA